VHALIVNAKPMGATSMLHTTTTSSHVPSPLVQHGPCMVTCMHEVRRASHPPNAPTSAFGTIVKPNLGTSMYGQSVMVTCSPALDPAGGARVPTTASGRKASDGKVMLFSSSR
jgi:hypothetical protein